MGTPHDETPFGVSRGIGGGTPRSTAALVAMCTPTFDSAEVFANAYAQATAPSSRGRDELYQYQQVCTLLAKLDGVAFHRVTNWHQLAVIDGYDRTGWRKHHNVSGLRVPRPPVLIDDIADEYANDPCGSGGICAPTSAAHRAEQLGKRSRQLPSRIDIGGARSGN